MEAKEKELQKKEAPKKPLIDAKLLAEVSQRIELDSIRCASLDAKILRAEEPSHVISLEFTFNTLWRRVDGRPGIDVVFQLFAKFVEQLPSGEKVGVFTLNGTWELSYSLPEVPPPDWDERFAMFASTNAVVNIWPYARAEVQDRLVRAGLPPLLLPVFRPGRGNDGRAEYRRTPRST